MRASLVCAVVLVSAALYAQSRPPDLSGRWRLVEPTPAERSLDMLAITSPDRLLITDTPREIVIEHPSKTGTHPEAGTFEYGAAAGSADFPAVAQPSTRGGASHISARSS